MRTIPAAWQAAADTAHSEKAHEQRLVVRVQIASGPDKYLWLTPVPVSKDAALQAWEAEGAWTAANNYGPFPLLLSVPDLKTEEDLVALAQVSVYVGNMVLSNSRNAELLAALSVARLSELLLNGYTFTGQTIDIYALHRGIAWADKLAWTLVVTSVDRWDLNTLSLSCSDRIGDGNAQANSRITAADFPGLPLNRVNSPKPIVLGGATAPALEVRASTVFTDRTGLAAVGGRIPTIRPNLGAPWATTDRVTFGSGSETVASIAGSDDTDTVLTMNSGGVPRTSGDGEGDLATDEQGYHVTSYPTSAEMHYVYADPDFTPPAPTAVRHVGYDGEALLPLPSYAGTPTNPSDGVVVLDKRPRMGRVMSRVYVEGDGTTVPASTVFGQVAEAKFGLAVGEYEVEAGAATAELIGTLEGAVSRLQLVQVLEKSSRSRSFWDGEKFKLRKRRTAAEVTADGADATITMDDLVTPPQAFLEIPTTARTKGFKGRYDRDPLRPSGDADSYRKTREVGTDASGRESEFWFDVLSDQTTAEEVIDFFFELLGPHSDGTWPRFTAVKLDWSFMWLEPEDVLALEIVDGQGNAFDGLSVGNAYRWRVISKHVTFPDPKAKTAGTVSVTLLEVHR